MSTRRASSGFLWNQIGRSLEFLFIYLQSIVIARFLGADLFGTFAILMGVVQLLLMAGSLGLETVAFSRLAKGALAGSPVEHGESLRALFVLRLAAVILTAAAGSFFIECIPPASPLGVALKGFPFLVIGYFAVRSLATITVASRIAGLETKRVALVSIVVRLLELTGIVLILSSGAGLKELLLWLSGTNLVLLLALLPSPQILFGRVGGGILRETARRGAQFWLANIFEFILGRQADVLLLGVFLVGRALIGEYEAAVGLAQGMNNGLTLGLYGVSVSFFASAASATQGDIRLRWEVLSRAVVLLVVPVLTFCIAYADAIIPGLYGRGFAGASLLFQIAAGIYLCTRLVGGGVAADYLSASGRSATLVGASVVSGAANIGLALLLIPRLGSMGALIATGAAALTIAGIHASAVRSALGVVFPWRSGLVLIVLGTVTTLVLPDALVGTRPQELALLAALYCGIFVALAYILKPLSMNDCDLIAAGLPLLSRALLPFARHPGKFPDSTGRQVTLTDRQKWGYAWTGPADVIVDLGSSDQPLARLLPHKAKRVIAVDTDSDALARLRKAAPDVEYVEAAAESLPFEAGSVDTVLFLDVLEHTGDPARAVREIARILRPGGALILSVPNKGMFRMFDPQNLGNMVHGRAGAQPYHRHYTTREIEAFLGREFRVVRRHYGGTLVYPSTFWLANSVRTRFAVDWSGWLRLIGDWDNDVSLGPLSYNLIVHARRT